MQVTGIFIYPIKATRGIELRQAEVRQRGLAGDRRWMVVDADGSFLHQRIHPRLALVETELSADGGLKVTGPGISPLQVARPAGDQRRRVTVWQDTFTAADAGLEAARWFSDVVGVPCHLTYMDQAADRPVAADYGQPGDVVSFADALPLLVTTEASLADLNRRLGQPLPMSRFRPNLVVGGSEAWEEDQWQHVYIGETHFEVTHPCARCVVTTIDQQTAERDRDGEPLKTLATFRRRDGNVYFGQNLNTRSTGAVRVGDEVRVATS